MSKNSQAFIWRKPTEALALHNLKKKKKALQARISTPCKTLTDNGSENNRSFSASAKRKNPFITNQSVKRGKSDAVTETEESVDDTLFKLLHLTNSSTCDKKNVIPLTDPNHDENCCEVVKAVGQRSVPVDWSLKTKVRFISQEPFVWSHKLKISDEASGTTSFARCIDIKSSSSCLDTSANAKFHQCCLFWQHPSLPWLNLFPRNIKKTSNIVPINLNNPAAKESLHNAWSDSLRSLFQLVRTRQCAYFYLCANNFTVLFRSAGLCGFSDTNALICPTTRGFRQLLKQEDIEFSLPLKKNQVSYTLKQQTHLNIDEENVDDADEDWLRSMGIKDEDIKQINYTQEKIQLKVESEADNSEESLVMVEGIEVQAFYNFLINCKSITTSTGPLAGVPPTLISPVAFRGATMHNLKVRESKVHDNNEDYYSLELTGPILPHTIHNLCSINPPNHSITATFANVQSTTPFSKIKLSSWRAADLTKNHAYGSTAFGKAGLSDCGLSTSIIEEFCSEDDNSIANIDCLKYSAGDESYSWT